MVIADPDWVWIVVVGFLISFVLAFGIGANDCANSFGTSVGSKVLTLKEACILATIFETAGAILLGSRVANTIRGGIVPVYHYEGLEDVFLLSQVSSLSGCCIWLMVATFLKLPVSASHSIVGAVVGSSLITLGGVGIKWEKLGFIVLSWFISPVMSGIISVGIFVIIRFFILNKNNPLEPGLKSLPFFYGLTIMINLFSILYKSDSIPFLRFVPIWGSFLIAFGIGVILGLVVFFFVVPWLREKITLQLRMLLDERRHSIIFQKEDHVPTVTETEVEILQELEKAEQELRREAAAVTGEQIDSKDPVESIPLTGPSGNIDTNDNKKNVDIYVNGVLKHGHGHHDGSINDNNVNSSNEDGMLLAKNDDAVKTVSKPIVVELSPQLSSSHEHLHRGDHMLTVPSDDRKRHSFHSWCGELTHFPGDDVSLASDVAPPVPGFKHSRRSLSVTRIEVIDVPETARLFSTLQILTAVFGAFAHGGNDVSNAIGPLLGLWVVAVSASVTASPTFLTMLWILGYGGVGISIGLWVWGRRVIRTIGEDLTRITPSSGFCIEIGSAITVLLASNLGIPISTTHCKVGSVVSVGRVRSHQNVDWKLFRNIVVAWFVTVPACAIISAAVAFILMHILNHHLWYMVTPAPNDTLLANITTMLPSTKFSTTELY